MRISLEIKNNNLGILSYLDALIRINEEFFELPVKCSGCCMLLTHKDKTTAHVDEKPVILVFWIMLQTAHKWHSAQVFQLDFSCAFYAQWRALTLLPMVIISHHIKDISLSPLSHTLGTLIVLPVDESYLVAE